MGRPWHRFSLAFLAGAFLISGTLSAAPEGGDRQQGRISVSMGFDEGAASFHSAGLFAQIQYHPSDSWSVGLGSSYADQKANHHQSYVEGVTSWKFRGVDRRFFLSARLFLLAPGEDSDRRIIPYLGIQAGYVSSFSARYVSGPHFGQAFPGAGGFAPFQANDIQIGSIEVAGQYYGELQLGALVRLQSGISLGFHIGYSTYDPRQSRAKHHWPVLSLDLSQFPQYSDNLSHSNLLRDLLEIDLLTARREYILRASLPKAERMTLSIYFEYRM